MSEPTTKKKDPVETPAVKPPPPGANFMRALLGDDVPPIERLERRQAALLATHAVVLDGPEVDALSVTEARSWVQRFKRANPMAWPATRQQNLTAFVRTTVSPVKPQHYQDSIGALLEVA